MWAPVKKFFHDEEEYTASPSRVLYRGRNVRRYNEYRKRNKIVSGNYGPVRERIYRKIRNQSEISAIVYVVRYALSRRILAFRSCPSENYVLFDAFKNA